jgi:1-acyl-sn-glycerol-3-phosphate acyltransferase
MAFVRAYCRLRVDGIEHLPRTGAFLLAANHSSHADTAVVYATMPPTLRRRVVAAAARDYFFNNGVRQVVSRVLFNTIPITREGVSSEDPLRHAVRALREGYGLLMFPEGTRSPNGEIGPFRSGIGRLIAQFPGLPVIPVAIIGTDRVLPKKATLPLPHPVQVRFGAPIYDLSATLTDKSSWRVAAQELRQAVIQLKQEGGEAS